MTRQKPQYGYCQVCQGPIVAGQFWTLTGNMYRTHENIDHCIQNLHTSKNVVVSIATGKFCKIPKKLKSEYDKQVGYSRERDLRTARHPDNKYGKQ